MRRFFSKTLATAKYLFYLLVLFMFFDLFSGLFLSAIKIHPAVWGLFPYDLTMLAQTSKGSIKPDKPVVLLGDSYAAGAGDWYENQKNNFSIEKFHSAHVIHDLTGRDVISLGQTGAGSSRGIPEAIISAYHPKQKTWLNRIENPDQIIIYFYEGNDLHDNIEWIAANNKCYQPFDPAQSNNPDYLEQYINNAITRNISSKAEKSNAFLKNFFVSHAMYSNVFKEKNQTRAYQCSPYKRFGRVVPDLDGTINKATINKKTVQIPDHLQAPPVDLNEEQFRFAVSILDISLDILKKNYPETPVGILYVPSVLSSYQITSETVHHQNHLEKTNFIHSTVALNKNHSRTVRSVKELARKHGMFFLDATATIRDASSRQVIHGPKDWNHFNRKGYEALGIAAADLLTAMGSAIQQGKTPPAK